ncbi:MAG: DHH family phosphoesterase [Clostridia bacterium]|nr:DHH family phosphoesterase [Clostridia bacterium]
MKKQQGSLSGRDVAVVVCIAALVIFGTIAVCTYTALDPLFVGMLAVFLFMTALAAYTTVRLANRTFAPVLPDKEEGGDLTKFLCASHHPALFCDLKNTVLWYNDAFLHATGESEIATGTPMDTLCSPIAPEALASDLQDKEVCSIGDTLYVYERTTMTGGGGFYLYTFHAVSAWNETSRALAETTLAAQNNQTAVAYIIIDNVEDLLQNIQERFREATANVAEILYKWVGDMNGVIRSYDRDKYIAFFRYDGLQACIENRFDVLDTIRSVHIDDQLPVTVSMGVSCMQGASLAERALLAQEAMDMALQRGGDQVVLRSESGIDFYGGKTKATYKRANVRARTVGLQLIRLMEESDNVLIMGHQNGDYDSFGATVGMARFALQHLDTKRVHIVVNRADKNLRSCFERLGTLADYREMFCDPQDAPALVTPNTLLIVLDVNHFPHTECPRLLDMVEKVAIIDHHTQSEAFEKKISLLYIEPSASSASELVAEILEQHLGAIRLEKEEAELMLSGILLDTKQLVRSTGTRTFGAARFLRGEGADPNETNELFKNDVSDMRKQAQFLSNTMIYREHIAIAVCEGNTDSSYRIIAAKAADNLLTGRGISASFALVTIGAKVHISARSDGTVNVAAILEELHGGGHFDAAGAQVDATEDSIERLRRAIDKHYRPTTK